MGSCQNKTGIEKDRVEIIIEAFLAIVMENVTNKKYLALSGFGRFGLKKRAEKIARIISRNEQIKIPAHFIPVFKPSKKFIEKLKTLIIEK